MMFDKAKLLNLKLYNIPIADYYRSEFIYGDSTLEASLIWFDKKFAFINYATEEWKDILIRNGWKYLLFDEFTARKLKEIFIET